MKAFNLVIGVVIVCLIVVVLLILDRTGILVWSGPASAGQTSLELVYDWRALPFTSNSREYKALFKLDSGYRDKPGTVPRIKIERVIEDRVYLLCEYVRDDQYVQADQNMPGDQRGKAQRFDFESGKYIETLDPEIFRPLVEAMEAGRSIPDRRVWMLGDRGYEAAVRIARTVAARCEGLSGASASDNRS
jgi:hypothetical protein